MQTSSSPRMQLLLHAPIPAMLWKLAAPNLLATLVLTSVTVADAWYIGHLGTAALASVAVVFPFQTLMQMMAGGAIGGGVTSALARALGGNDQTHADSVGWHAIVIACVMSLVFVVALGLFCRPVFSVLGAKGEVLEGAVRYARLAFGGATVTWLFYALAAVLRGTGDTTTPARAIIASSMAQVALSGLFTLGSGPIPALGIIGPPAAFILCQGAAAIVMARHFLGGRAGVHIRPQAVRWRPFGDIMRVGGIGLLNSLTIVATVVTVTWCVGRYGTEALAGYGLGSRLELMLVPIVFGIGGALTAAVGINYGARQYARARRIAWSGAGAALLITGAIGLGVWLAPNVWLGRFTADPKAYAYGALYLGIAAPFYGLFGAGQTLYFASQGTGRMLLPVLVGLLRFAIVATAGAFAVSRSLDISVVFSAVAAGLAVIGIGLGLCLLSPVWRPEPAAAKQPA
ncbi:MAG: MATE family efflux transporter [Hyphomicrobiaceae bacterium]